MFINFTNHPSALWDDNQRSCAQVYGEIVDIPFPSVRADLGEADISEICEAQCEKIIEMNPKAVLCQGEFTLCYAVISRLLAQGITVLAACSERVSEELPDENGERVKHSVFRFCRFRRYGG